jgi:hypothetical protein
MTIWRRPSRPAAGNSSTWRHGPVRCARSLIASRSIRTISAARTGTACARSASATTTAWRSRTSSASSTTSHGSPTGSASLWMRAHWRLPPADRRWSAPPARQRPTLHPDHFPRRRPVWTNARHSLRTPNQRGPLVPLPSRSRTVACSTGREKSPPVPLLTIPPRVIGRKMLPPAVCTLRE